MRRQNTAAAVTSMAADDTDISNSGQYQIYGSIFLQQIFRNDCTGGYTGSCIKNSLQQRLRPLCGLGLKVCKQWGLKLVNIAFFVYLNRILVRSATDSTQRRAFNKWSKHNCV